MEQRVCLDVQGRWACFTRPENRVERLSYPVITPSAARAVFDAILWKPAIRWQVEWIEVLAPPRWISVRRNEVGAVVSVRNAIAAMNAGEGRFALYVENEREQRAGLFLRDVHYRLHARMRPITDEARTNPAKYHAMFERRARAGQCVNQPYLGCREFAARFRLVPLKADAADGAPPIPVADEPPALDWSDELGWMLYDLDYRDDGPPQAMFFRATVDRGVIDLRGLAPPARGGRL